MWCDSQSPSQEYVYMIHLGTYRQLRARRALLQFKDIPLRTRKALAYHHRLCTAIAPFWFSTEHLWAAITPFWLSNDDMICNYASCMYSTSLIHYKICCIVINTCRHVNMHMSLPCRKCCDQHPWKSTLMFSTKNNQPSTKQILFLDSCYKYFPLGSWQL